MTGLLLQALADAFMEVGVYVAIFGALFGWARMRWGQRLDEFLLTHRRWGPVLAAALTMPPGCAGAIVVMAIYVRGYATFGAAVAALAATMGDATWVILAAEPLLTLKLKLLLLIVGSLSGLMVDALGIAPPLKRDRPEVPMTSAGCADHGRVAPDGGPGGTLTQAGPKTAVTPVTTLMWVLLTAGFLVSLPVSFALIDQQRLTQAIGLDLYLVIGLVGTVLAVAIFARNRCRVADHTVNDSTPRSIAEVLHHSTRETSFITVWVAVAYIAWTLVSEFTGFDGDQLPTIGILGVLIGALIGLIPGCGVQIVFAGLFVAGGVPLPAFVANSVSQDGDALIPLLAMERRSAILATLITTCSAVIAGTAVLLLQ